MSQVHTRPHAADAWHSPRHHRHGAISSISGSSISISSIKQVRKSFPYSVATVSSSKGIGQWRAAWQRHCRQPQAAGSDLVHIPTAAADATATASGDNCYSQR